MAGNPLAALGMRAGYNTGRDRAKALAISRSHLMHIERGAIFPSETIIARMAAVYDRPEEMIVRAARLSRRRLTNCYWLPKQQHLHMGRQRYVRYRIHPSCRG